MNYSALNKHKLYLPGLALDVICPHCKKTTVVDMEYHYPYNIKPDGSGTLGFSCTHCEEAIEKTVQVTIGLTFAD